MTETATKKISLKAQSAWLLFAKIVGYGFTIILPLLIVRFLSQEKVGTYREAFQVIANAASILPLGFSMSAYYFLARETERRAAAIFNILIFNFTGGALAFLTLFFYPQLLGNIFHNEELVRLAPVIGIVIWLWLFSAFLETAAIANQEAKLATIFIISAQLSKTLLMVMAVTLFSSVESIIYAALIQSAIQTIVLLIYLHSRFPHFWREFTLKFFRRQAAYALPFGFIGILYTLQNDIHNYFVGYRFSEAEFAVYAYGCFQLPLIFMLSESVTSVLIPRVSELQLINNKDEIIRLTARAMQKLALFYFPLYIFFLITAPTFITTMFGENYAASVPIFRINLTFLPFLILITDPIVRAYQELSRILLIVRVFLLTGMIAALFFGISHFGLTGMIAVVLAVYLIEKAVAETIILKKIGIGRRHFYLLENVWKTAVVAVLAGAFTYLVYTEAKEFMTGIGAKFSAAVFSAVKPSVAQFFDGGLILFAAALVFTPIYFAGAYYWNLIDDEEKQTLRNATGKLKIFFKKDIIGNQESQI